MRNLIQTSKKDDHLISVCLFFYCSNVYIYYFVTLDNYDFDFNYLFI